MKKDSRRAALPQNYRSRLFCFMRRYRWGLIVIALIFLSIAKDVYWFVRLSFQERSNEKAIAAIERKFVELSDEQQRLKQDDVYVEDLLRSTFKHARPGELIVPMGSGNSLEEAPKTATVNP